MISEEEKRWPDPCCCSTCGNYYHQYGLDRNYERFLIPSPIRCWFYFTGDCYRDPRRATPAQMKKRSIIIRNPDVGKECAICLKKMIGRYVKRIPCGHYFHMT